MFYLNMITMIVLCPQVQILSHNGSTSEMEKGELLFSLGSLYGWLVHHRVTYVNTLLPYH
ncbi:hypothetical protein Lalb_Chr07g0179231 [Lupinus albus]|uniref:Uncharacterized protein n=1 Tax=Lupinus albus TaxID=3870 RepID=A0A6A4Q767_LUPAL|nr:hypothetical protein Lalb_Chr07g0179231 [Lupinus albus]